MDSLNIPQDRSKALSRRAFIKGAIVGGAGVASANYLFRASMFDVRSQTIGDSERLVHGEFQNSWTFFARTVEWWRRRSWEDSTTSIGSYRPRERP
jgi:hypothetical protein